MVERLREFLRTGGGRTVAVGLVVIGLIAAFVSFRGSFGESEAASLSRDRLYICAQTGKPFRLEVEPGMRYPVMSPHSGAETGYQAEFCYWTKDGKLKKEATPVLLNQYAKKKEPTFCPDCGRLVVPQNPPGIPGDKPPPTQAEYKPERPEL